MSDERDPSRLGFTIVSERMDELAKEYYRPVTYATFSKWYMGDKPYLKDWERYGGGVDVDEWGNATFMMPKRSRYKMKKGKAPQGGKMAIDRRSLSKSETEVRNMTSLMEMRNIKTRSGKDRTIVIIPYERMPSEYGGGYTFEGNEMKEKSGRMSKADRLVLRSIRKWASEQGYEISVESTYKE